MAISAVCLSNYIRYDDGGAKVWKMSPGGLYVPVAACLHCGSCLSPEVTYWRTWGWKKSSRYSRAPSSLSLSLSLPPVQIPSRDRERGCKRMAKEGGREGRKEGSHEHVRAWVSEWVSEWVSVPAAARPPNIFTYFFVKRGKAKPAAEAEAGLKERKIER